MGRLYVRIVAEFLCFVVTQNATSFQNMQQAWSFLPPVNYAVFGDFFFAVFRFLIGPYAPLLMAQGASEKTVFIFLDIHVVREIIDW